MAALVDAPLTFFVGQMGFLFDGATLYCRLLDTKRASIETWAERCAYRVRWEGTYRRRQRARREAHA